MNDDLIGRPLDEEFDTQHEVERNPCGAWQAIQSQASRIEDLQAEVARLRGALEWYRGNVSWCNNFSREGTEARDRLVKDKGAKASAALEDTP